MTRVVDCDEGSSEVLATQITGEMTRSHIACLARSITCYGDVETSHDIANSALWATHLFSESSGQGSALIPSKQSLYDSARYNALAGISVVCGPEIAHGPTVLQQAHDFVGHKSCALTRLLVRIQDLPSACINA